MMSKVSKFEEYIAQSKKIQIYKIMKITSKYKSHKKRNSTKLRIMQLNVNVCINISSNI